MKKKKNKIVLASGRFDNPHPGHFITIKRLAEQYSKVVVVILYTPKRRWPAQYAKQFFEEAFAGTGLPVEIVINKTHFARVTREEALEICRFDVYASGNVQCLNHMERLGFEVLYTDRAFDYSSRNYLNPSD